MSRTAPLPSRAWAPQPHNTTHSLAYPIPQNEHLDACRLDILVNNAGIQYVAPVQVGPSWGCW